MDNEVEVQGLKVKFRIRGYDTDPKPQDSGSLNPENTREEQ